MGDFGCVPEVVRNLKYTAQHIYRDILLIFLVLEVHINLVFFFYFNAPENFIENVKN